MATFIGTDANNNITYQAEPAEKQTMLPNTGTAKFQDEIARILETVTTYRGQPVVVTAAEDMTDETVIYLYMGDEEGYNADHWYYYDTENETWTDGGAYVANPVTIDDTLTQAGEAADAKATGDAIDDVKADLSETVKIKGIAQVTPQNLQIVDAELSPNLIDENAVTNGKYINKSGTETSNNSYFVTDFIPVEAGAVYYGTKLYTNPSTSGTTVQDLSARYLTCYDSNKTIMASAGSDVNTALSPYTVPAGVAFIRLSIYNTGDYSEFMFTKGSTAVPYIPYGELMSAVIKSKYIPALQLVDGQNLLNPNDPDYLTGKYIKKDGTIGTNSAYIASGYISVSPGDILLGSYKAESGNTATASLTYVICFDSTKTVMSSAGTDSGTYLFVVPEGVAFIRASIRIDSYTQYLQVEKSKSNYPKPYVPYVAPHYELKEDYMFPMPDAPENVYLPSDIYVAVGRTIELYNKQIVLDYEKYHFRWVCSKGNAYSRKFSITGDSAGDQNLYLYLYDDKKNLCWIGRCIIHIVAASNPTKKILPIGDSLTNWKAWLQETMLLSESHITWLGTRYSGLSVDSEGNEYASGTIHHEGRSGWSASDYLANSTYTFDDRYDGVGTVSGTANPFWDGDKFSLSHYLTVQTGVDTPDAVQIFLGTNDVRNGADVAAENIVSIVDKIRTEYPSMPIFVCNTIYRSIQDGYGSVGNDAYAESAGANAWQYNADTLIMDLMKLLKTALATYTDVYMIPLACCMDREYDFGQVMTKVNPRSTVEVPMPTESIHPQAPGYYQMADLMYSTYCGILG